MSTEINRYIGGKVRYFRQKKSISIKDFAKQLYVTRSTVSRYETGKRGINLDTLSNILNILEISFDDIFPSNPIVRIFKEYNYNGIWPMKVYTNEMEPVIPKNSYILVLKGTAHIHSGDIVIALNVYKRLEIVKVYFTENIWFGKERILMM